MFRSIVNTFGNCFKIPELKSRILFTLGVLAICRLIACIRIPGLDGTALADYFDSSCTGRRRLLGMYSTFAGGAMEHCAIGALGIMPYISATIIIQLLTAVCAAIEQAGARRRWPGENHPIRPLPDGAVVRGTGTVFCDRLGKS